MSNIVLKNLKQTDDVARAETRGFLYKDLSLDLSLKYTTSGELFKTDDQLDLRPSYDKEAILTSISNILTTTPGEKLLNPTFGLDLRSFLFDPVSDTRAYFIGDKIFNGITIYEPRIRINTVEVIAIIDEHEYDITLDISIPSLNISNLSLKGVLNMDGYTIS